MIVAVASRNPNKLRAVQAAYKLFGMRAQVVPVEKPMSLPPQPIGVETVVAGAIERARAALSVVQNAEHGVGIEAGVLQAGGRYLDVTVAAIADRNGVVTIGFGPAFQVPDIFLNDVLRGVELGVLAERYFGRVAIGYKEGIIGVLTKGVVSRFDLNMAAVVMALVPRLSTNAPLYRF